MLNLPFTHRANIARPARRPAPSVPAAAAQPSGPRNLAQAGAGKSVTVTGFGKLSAAHKQHLQAYGLLPGRTLYVLAQRPVTIVLIEQTELAFETEIARQVLID